MTLLSVQGLDVHLPRTGQVLQDFSLDVRPGEMLALVGESGSGKTVAALAMLRLLPPGAVARGGIRFNGANVLAMPAPALRRLRGGGIGMVFQDALGALNPAMRVGVQIAEAFLMHQGGGPSAGRARALALLEEVGLDDPPRCVNLYPHQLSGGMRQRVLVACALAGGPKMLIADEPTSGLDSVSAAQILGLLARLRRDRGLGVLLISHDLAAVRAHADTVHVLYAGRSVETAPDAPFFRAPAHPYSRALLAAAPMPQQRGLTAIPGALPEPSALPAGCRFATRCVFRQPICDLAYPPPVSAGGGWAACHFPLSGPMHPAPSPDWARGREPGAVVLSVGNVSVRYNTGFFGAKAAASVSDVSFDLRRGECLGVVGASGSGKTTLGRAVLHMIPYEGEIALHGVVFGRRPGAQRRRIQAVFQDPRQSLNPTLRIEDVVAEPLLLAGTPRAARLAAARALLARVGLPESLAGRRADQISGGQAQRVAIARALAAAPDVLVLDEPTSSLDVSTQAGVLTLLRELAAERGFATILITHDAAVVAAMADRVAVMAGGRLSLGPLLA